MFASWNVTVVIKTEACVPPLNYFKKKRHFFFIYITNISTSNTHTHTHTQNNKFSSLCIKPTEAVDSNFIGITTLQDVTEFHPAPGSKRS